MCGCRGQGNVCFGTCLCAGACGKPRGLGRQACRDADAQFRSTGAEHRQCSLVWDLQSSSRDPRMEPKERSQAAARETLHILEIPLEEPQGWQVKVENR